MKSPDRETLLRWGRLFTKAAGLSHRTHQGDAYTASFSDEADLIDALLEAGEDECCEWLPFLLYGPGFYLRPCEDSFDPEHLTGSAHRLTKFCSNCGKPVRVKDDT